MKRKILLLCCTTLVLIASIVGAMLVIRHTPEPVKASGSGDWPMLQGDIMRSGMNANESVITPATAHSLKYAWKFTTSQPVVASPAIVSGILYEGSWDGYEYAINTATQQLVWKQYLGVTQQSKQCYNLTVGVTSSAAIDNGVLYVGGGDGYLYALHTSDGSIIWKTLLALAPDYNFASPVVYNNLVYTGLSAFCDPPFVHGKVLAFHTSDGSLAASIDLVPNKQTGATVWSSPAVDATTNTIYVTTGNSGSQPTSKQTLSEAFVALDATTLAVKGSWQIPQSQQILDSDFGATPTLFDLNGKHYIGALNKDGIYYVLDRTNLAAGPIWEQVVSAGSDSGYGGDVSPSCYNNGILYVASAGMVFNGKKYYGAMNAFDAATGTNLWSVHAVGYVVAPATCTNGLVVDGQGSTVEVRDATTGKILFAYQTGKRVEGASVISNGVLYTPSVDDSIYAFTIGGLSTPTPVPTITPTVTPTPSPITPTPSSTPPTASVIFQDNFDSYAPGPLPTGSKANQWSALIVNGTGFALGVSNTQARSAPNALQFTMGSGKGGHAAVLEHYSTINVAHAARFSLYLDTSLTYANQAITLFTTQNRDNVYNGSIAIVLAADRTLQVIWYDSQGKKHMQPMSATGKLASGQWYTIELDQFNDPAQGSWTLLLNGTQLAAQTGIDMGNLGVNAIMAGDPQNASAAMSGFFYEDDIITGTSLS